ncbi:MAG TPA: glycosyltransferase [Allosphingosinicella sp.]|nr:glycosyltransferase [Allosphingosinicella sp.]
MPPCRPILSIRIGLHIASAEQDPGPSLLALYENTRRPFELVLLADGVPDSALAAWPRLRRCRLPDSPGAPASFNQLIGVPSDLYVFLEAGARPAPGWLDLIVDALEDAPAAGLAGPSTNLCWNAQAVAFAGGPGARDLRSQAAILLDRHGPGPRSMAPLYGLSDFALAVRREVVEAIGGADTGYGRGPCWEMDYAARAARAGFDSLWVPAAYVHRNAVGAQRAAEERALFDSSKRLYQDRFCGRRAGEDSGLADYRDHCRGDDCPNFAPPGSTRLSLPLPEPLAEDRDEAIDPPLISCIMPTRGRPRFVARAIAFFRRQDYPNRQLVIVHRDDGDLPEAVEAEDVVLVRTDEESIGAMRNRAVAAADGDIVVHWDDDDWHGPHRLSRQAAPILDGVADITGLNDTLFLVVPSEEYWEVTPDLFAKLFVENVHGGTLMFNRDSWRRSGPYPEISLREDAVFLSRALADGARLCRLGGRRDFVYIRHGANTWRFDEGRYLGEGWGEVEAPGFMAEDRPFYSGGPPKPPARPRPAPLASCIMPTRNRRRFVPAALEGFLHQDHSERELIVLDDGDEDISDLVPDHPAIRYLRLDGVRSVGAKRNLACEMARGDIIAHWDDDDWMAPGWLSSQVATLTGRNADICGLDKVYFHDALNRRSWRYVYEGAPPWLCGGTLCYTKAFWRRSPFPDIAVGEDNAFVWSRSEKTLAVNPEDGLYVASVHAHNTSPRLTSGPRWHPVDIDLVEALIGLGARDDHGGEGRPF